LLAEEILQDMFCATSGLDHRYIPPLVAGRVGYFAVLGKQFATSFNDIGSVEWVGKRENSFILYRTIK
jgi:hypothetical protein